jgi:hypothetical protein
MNNGTLDPEQLTTYELWYGRDEPPPPHTCLHAGPLTALWEAGDLRGVRLGELEVLRRVYVSVRDENWDTIPAALTNVSTDVRTDRFVISYDARNSSRNLELQWHATITGEPDGTIALTVEGQATRDFSYCRIGFCLLHPLAEYCGQPYWGNGPQGPVSGTLPTPIAPQRFEGGFYLPLFPSVSCFTVLLKNGAQARFAFEGDLFEMEDQRNWTDGSFKTYCTPLSLGYPFQAQVGQRFKQKVTFTVQGCPQQASVRDSKVRLDLGPSLRRRLPAIGLGIASHERDLSSEDADLLRRLRLDHLRADLHLGRDAVERELARAERECGLLRCGLELALFLTDNADRELQSLASRLPLSVPISRVLVFHEKEPTTSARWIKMAREALAPRLAEISIGGGTNLYFAELNRFRPDVSALDAVAFSINPQVHASDERSLVENLEGQADTVATARAFCGSRPIIVSPVTLKPRFNPDAVGPEPPPLPGELPSAVDARQMSLFAAVWTLGSVKQLSEAGAASLTFYETTGWRGVKETHGGCPLPEIFRSFPSMVFPVYHIFAHLADLKDGELVTCSSSDPLRIQGLAVRTGESLHILIANLTAEPQECALAHVAGGHVLTRTLDAIGTPLAMTHPEEFRSEAKLGVPVSGSTLTFTLQPYSVVKIDSASVPF